MSDIGKLQSEHSEIIDRFLAQFDMPLDARVFLLRLWNAVQFLDDVVDNDPRTDAVDQVYNIMVGLLTDPFLDQHRAQLVGVIGSAFHKWAASHQVEVMAKSAGPETSDDMRATLDRALDVAFVWRASFYDVVMACAALSMPQETVKRMAPGLLSLYGERREDYRKEFQNA